MDQGILTRVRGGSNHSAEGLYGPTYLADWIVINSCPKFFKQIHDLFEILDKSANLKNSTFSREINSIISQKDREIERITGQRDDIVKQFEEFRHESKDREDKLLEQISQIREENAHTHHRLDLANNQLTQANNQLAQTNDQLTQANNQIENLTQTTEGLRNLVIDSTNRTTQRLNSLTDHLNDVLPNSRITRGMAKELLIILRRPSLENDMRDLDLINENENVFDTISCQAKDKYARLSDHNFNKDSDEIALELEVPNSIDLAYFAKTDLQDGRQRMGG